jgi:membrane dipeptidase
MLICDTHADTLYSMATNPGHKTDVTLERLKTAGVSLETLALFVGSSTDKKEIARFNGLMMEALKRLLREGWEQADDPRDARAGETRFMLSVEGCEIFEDGLETIGAWRARGVRMAALTWNYENALGYPAKHDMGRGLKPYGREAVNEMLRVGIAPDVSHLNERGFWNILEMGAVPVASHSCCKALCGHARNLTDEQLRALFKAGGYVGVNFYPYFLNENGGCTLQTVADHVIHMFEMGGEGKVGFGSDFDGIECKVKGLENPLDVPALIKTLKARGLSQTQVEGVAGENLLAYYDRVFPRNGQKEKIG